MLLENICPICTSTKISEFLSRKNIPIQQNFLLSDRTSAINVPRGNLDLVICEDCGFTFNQSFDPSKLTYTTNYDNSQDFSLFFENYLSKLANYLINEKKIQHSNIVEVGCGKGSFLRKLVERDELNNVGYGFDPSYVGPHTALDGRLKFQTSYYDSKCSTIPADVVICRHVIEHVPRPLNLLQTIKQALINSQHAHVFFETPDVEWILYNQVIWDFFYEHCSYFSPQSIVTLFETAGFRVENVRRVFEGQYIWLEATIPKQKPDITKNQGKIPTLAKQFAASESSLIKQWLYKIKKLNSFGKVALWGAGAKGVTFANLIDPECKWIDCVIDLNPQKHGKYVSGTGHLIINYKEVAQRKVKNAILMNPNYYNEILELLKKDKLNINLLV